MNLSEIKLSNYSNLICESSVSDDHAVMYLNIKGKYRAGSEGNFDGLYLFSFLVAHYFIFEPISIIIDLSDLDYSWGNTILKSLNFFFEIGRDNDEKNKITIIIQSNKNDVALRNILSFVNEGNWELYDKKEDALKRAKENVKEYLKN